MNIHIVSLFPEFAQQVARYGVTGRAVERGKLALQCWNPRDYAQDVHRTVDDRPYGGGPGMVMQIEPTRSAVAAARKAAGTGAKVIYLSPQGETLTQQWAERLAAEPAMVLLCGRYEGVDERLIASEADLELSIGDYVLSGGELAAMVVVDAVARLLPGVLGDAESAEQDSFVSGLLDHPHYSRPEQAAQGPVPEVLLSGDHAAIARWRLQQALGRTWLRRPELLEELDLNSEQQTLLQEMIKQYLAEQNSSADVD
ncbi:MAG: tRNA (guanosine(37)-N1)-methyltransferase TrmD [Salinisphaeraceae bacterium]|nr:tRNA (guanosine(37)-N1)-methyltransferase TrmD [Salinisphaeraceae bacterium]